MSAGGTSGPHAGQWYVPSGRSRISGWLHSQALLPKASGRSVIYPRASTIIPHRCPPHVRQRVES